MVDFNHHVSLVLDNEQGTYEYVRELVGAAIIDGERDARDLAAQLGLEPNVDGAVRRIVGERLREYVEDLVFGDVGDAVYDGARTIGSTFGVMARELIGCAMSSVDWDALAVRYVESVREEA